MNSFSIMVESYSNEQEIKYLSVQTIFQLYAVPTFTHRTISSHKLSASEIFAVANKCGRCDS